MASKPTVTLTFAGDEKKLTAAIDRVTASAKDMGVKVGAASTEMADKAVKSSSQVQKAFSTAGGVLLAQGAAFAANQAVGFLKGMIDEAREAEKVSRSTAQGIATMGAASWITAKQVGDLAEAISNKIGVDDEAIQQSANLLLTFGNVKNQAGALNNVFDRAVLAAQDLAAKGFGDADSAAKMLGKALNDPVKGLTALGKAGVTFTEDQKKQIKNMVEHGDLLGAQKVLLAEIEKQVGGTAEATVSAGDKMAVTWANFQEDLGEAVLPILDKVLGKLMEFIHWAEQHQTIVAAIGAITAAIWLLNFAMNANPVVLIATGIGLLVTAILVLWTQSEGFRKFFHDLWEGIKLKVETVVGNIKDTWNGVVDFFKKLPERIGAALGSMGGFIGDAFKAAVNAAIDFLNKGVDRVNDLIHGINIVNPFEDIRPVPHIPRLHTGGMVGGAPGTETLRILQAGETVLPRGQSSTGQSGGGGPYPITLELVNQIQGWFNDGTLVPVGR